MTLQLFRVGRPSGILYVPIYYYYESYNCLFVYLYVYFPWRIFFCYRFQEHTYLELFKLKKNETRKNIT